MTDLRCCSRPQAHGSSGASLPAAVNPSGKLGDRTVTKAGSCCTSPTTFKTMFLTGVIFTIISLLFLASFCVSDAGSMTNALSSIRNLAASIANFFKADGLVFSAYSTAFFGTLAVGGMTGWLVQNCKEASKRQNDARKAREPSPPPSPDKRIPGVNVASYQRPPSPPLPASPDVHLNLTEVLGIEHRFQHIEKQLQAASTKDTIIQQLLAKIPNQAETRAVNRASSPPNGFGSGHGSPNTSSSQGGKTPPAIQLPGAHGQRSRSASPGFSAGSAFRAIMKTPAKGVASSAPSSPVSHRTRDSSRNAAPPATAAGQRQAFVITPAAPNAQPPAAVQPNSPPGE